MEQDEKKAEAKRLAGIELMKYMLEDNKKQEKFKEQVKNIYLSMTLTCEPKSMSV